MKNKSIMFWVVLTLLIVGSLPFLLSWYQISQSRSAVIDQAQKNHLIISLATADRLEAYLNKYRDLASNLALNPDVYLTPDSVEAADSMKAGLVSNQDIQLIALLLRDSSINIQIDVNQSVNTQVIQLARKNESIDIDVEQLIALKSAGFKLLELSNDKYLTVVVPSARPNVDVIMLVDVDMSQWLNPHVLGQSASISLVDAQGQLMEHAGDEFEAVPTEWLNLFKSGVANGGANLSEQKDNQFIAAFAKVNNLPWYVMSRQSVAFAEQTTANMSRTAWTAFSLVLIVMAALLAMAYYSWVKPIRRIVKAQSALMGEKNQPDWRGGEVMALEQSFDALTKHIDDRNALGQIFVDRYQVISPIGKGGMGSVFLGRDPRLDRHVALKTLPIGKKFGSRESMSQTLVQEAITAAKISHRNVVSIYDVVSTKNTAFIAMEYIKGESLSSLLQRKRSLNLSLTLSIAIAILKGLDSAHKMGFIHRDIKPANILLDVNGDIKITDFGTATLVNGIGADNVTGTHGYMAPEIYQKGDASLKSDLFAVGVVMAECLLGQNPFKGKKISQTKFNTLNKTVTFPPWIRTRGTEELFKTIEMLLEKDPAKRPDSASIMAEQIVQATPFTIKWVPEDADIKIQINDGDYENEETIVAYN